MKTLEDRISDGERMEERRREYHDKRNTYASRSDLKSLEKKIDKGLQSQQQQQNQSQTQTTGRSAIKWISTGFSNIAQSLNSPNSSRRMRIAQMPGKRSDMDIIRKADLHSLKSPELRNLDIRGKREKYRKRGTR